MTVQTDNGCAVLQDVEVVLLDVVRREDVTVELVDRLVQPTELRVLPAGHPDATVVQLRVVRGKPAHRHRIRDQGRRRRRDDEHRRDTDAMTRDETPVAATHETPPTPNTRTGAAYVGAFYGD